MFIKEIECKKEKLGIKPFSMKELKDIVVLAGENGSGKTRFFKLIENGITKKKNNESVPDINIDINGDGTIINFSHSELSLQLPTNFPPYVINISEENLKRDNNFTRTSYEALLYITRLARYGDKQELDNFNEKFCKPLLGCEVIYDYTLNKVFLFDNISIDDLAEKPLSPGQTYLLRLCVALSCRKNLEGSIILLDEPETHLHPKALLILFDILRNKFSFGQIWIATHSVELISHFYYESIWYMHDGQIKPMGSRSDLVINGLIGDENKRSHLYQFITSPDIYALCTFATECLLPPGVISGVDENDASTGLVNSQLNPIETVVDFGAGKGRFCERLLLEKKKSGISVNYYAYDEYGYKKDSDGSCSADECKKQMKKYGAPTDHYAGECSEIKKLYKLNADKVVMINVLHEISPKKWLDTFGEISKIISPEKGYVLIVERTELTYGEKPYESDFFVLQPECIEVLFECSKTDYEVKIHKTSKRVVTYLIPARLLQKASNETIKSTILKLKEVSISRIKEIKQENSEGADEKKQDKDEDRRWLNGIRLAFWSQQYVNTCLYDMNELETNYTKGDINNETVKN